METIPWYQSAIVRQQITAAVIAIAGLFGINLGGLDVDATVASIFLGIGAVIAVYTVITRLFKPNPNLTQKAVEKERELVADGKLSVQAASGAASEGGFVSVRGVAALAITAALIACVAFVLPGCAGTASAYKTASASPEALRDTAYVVAEHYAIVSEEAANIAVNAATPDSIRDAIKKADAALRPIFTGDPTANRPGLRDLIRRYESVRNAQTQLELQNAVNEAIRELANLINAVKTARGVK